MKQVGLFVDTDNIYYCVNKKFRARKLDYEKLTKRVGVLGTVKRAIAYGTQIESEAAKFITYLRKLGFDTKYRKPRRTRRDEMQRVDWNVGLSMDVVRIEPQLDMVVLVSSNPLLIDLVTWVKDRGKRVVVLACGIPRELGELAEEFIEITEGLLEE